MASGMRTLCRARQWIIAAISAAAMGLAGCRHPVPPPTGPASARPSIEPALGATCKSGADETHWLIQQSMLSGADRRAEQYSGTGGMWRHPYAESRPRAASALASVWFTSYAAATLTGDRETVLNALGDSRLWKRFAEIGIEGIHSGPIKRAGGVTGCRFTPSIDGNYDRIGTEIDPLFGTEEEYRTLVANARANGAFVIGDAIPGHSGKGPDFRLAERAYGPYPGLYHMVQIDRKDWELLPPVPEGKDSVNLKPAVVDELKERGYIVGRLPRTIFYVPNVKESDWSATAVSVGADGTPRRWVYLHYFKQGQPTFNWLDPTFAAERLIAGDALHSLRTLGESILRLDANGFLGIERKPGAEPAWSEAHPLSITANQLIAGLVRKAGGYTFQELNLTLDDLKNMSREGADLSYDFVTRPAYHHALVTGDAEFLRLMLRQMVAYNIDPAGLIHGLQNHDELTLELVHFSTHKDDLYRFRGKEMTGAALRDLIRKEMFEKLTGDAAPYNLRSPNGVSCTTATVAAAALGLRDLSRLRPEQKQEIQKLHLLLALYNALQPGVFALSGWDLVGAITLPKESVRELLADGDTRWINRGAYDLLGSNPGATQSKFGLPRANVLYGALPEQLADPGSFASRLAALLRTRKAYRIGESTQIDVPDVKSKGLLVMVQKLPEGDSLEVTVINFGKAPIDEKVAIKTAAPSAQVRDLLGGEKPATLVTGSLAIRLGAYEGRALLVK